MNGAIRSGRIGIDINSEDVAIMSFQRISSEELVTVLEVQTERLKPVLYAFIMTIEGSITFVARTDRSNNLDIGITGCSRYISIIGVVNEYLMHGYVSATVGISCGYPSTTYHKGVQKFVKDAFNNISKPIGFLR
jgi:hypothetical protein